MKTIAKQIITTAAVAAGLADTSVMDKPAKQSITLPSPRVEIELQPQAINRNPRRIARLPGTVPTTHIQHRWRTHTLKLMVRVVIRGEDEAWLEQFYKDFIVALPHKTADSDNNLVTVEANRAVFGGFETKLVEVIKKREIPVWIEFTGGIYKDEEVPLITDVNIKDGVAVS